MEQLQKIKVGDKVYECFVATYFGGDFDAILKADDICTVKTDFSDFDEIVIMSSIGLVLDKLTMYKEIKSVSEIPDYYADDDGNLKSVIRIVLKEIDTTSKIKELESKINPSINEALMSLEEYKEYKITESKTLLKEYLGAHPITSAAHGGVEGVYSITEEKQNEMVRNYFNYQIETSLGKNPVLTWNETGKTAVEWTVNEYLQLSIEIRERVTSLVSYQRQLEENINQMTDKEDIAAIVIDYDSVMAN